MTLASPLCSHFEIRPAGLSASNPMTSRHWIFKQIQKMRTDSERMRRRSRIVNAESEKGPAKLYEYSYLQDHTVLRTRIVRQKNG